MSVVIVGAGAAGLAAAQLLCKHEFNVVILEARNRAGGRINPVSVPVVSETAAVLSFAAC
jgi:monoamine oxidase